MRLGFLGLRRRLPPPSDPGLFGVYACSLLLRAGKTLQTMVGVTTASLGCDLLVSRKEILQFESDGYRLSSRL